MTPTYNTTKKFMDWLKTVKPELKIKNPLRINKDDELDFIEYTNGTETLPVITADLLHTILWELFDVETYTELDTKSLVVTHLNYFKTYPIYAFDEESKKQYKTTKADALWQKYTAQKDSMWITNPDEVLEDIMEVYEQL